MAVAAAAAAAAAAISSSTTTAPPLRPEPMATDAGGIGGGFNALHGYGGMMVHEHM